MSSFHLHAHEAPPSRREERAAKASPLAHAILLLVTALLIWSIASRPLQFFAPSDTARHCVYYGRAGASCAPDARPETREPRR